MEAGPSNPTKAPPTTGGKAKVKLEEPNPHNQVPYNSRHMEAHLRSSLKPGETLSSTTLPRTSAPNVRRAGGEKILPTGERIVFDTRGFPIFDKYCKFETRIPKDIYKADSSKHMRQATRDLRDAINRGEVSKNIFTPKQLHDIVSGKERIHNLTWHHHQEHGRMQLIDRKLHQKVGHLGGDSLWGNNVN